MTQPLTFSALGTTWWIEIFSEVNNQRRDELVEFITAQVYSIEHRFSRFLPDSLITTLNQNRTLTTTDHDLLTLITLGQELYTATHGTFNCLLGEHLEARGYDATYSFTPKVTPTIFPNPLTDIKIQNNTITLLRGKFDLGGYGKGWAIDCVAKLLTREGVAEFLINAGGDMYGTSEGGKPIVIYLEHPLLHDTHIGSTPLFHQGFAASSPHKRSWKHNHTTITHIVDTTQAKPETQEQRTDGMFVKAHNAVLADAFATTGLLMPAPTLLSLAPLYSLGLAFYNDSSSTLTTNSAFND